MATTAAILDFQLEQFYLYFIYKSPLCFLPSFNWPVGSIEEGKSRFSRWRNRCHLGFLIRMILAIFDLQLTPLLPTEFQVNWPFGSGDEAKSRFSWFTIITILVIFYLQGTPMYVQSFKSICLLVQEKRKIDFHDGCHAGHLGFMIGTILAIFFIYKSPQCFLLSFKSICLWVQEKKRTRACVCRTLCPQLPDSNTA